MAKKKITVNGTEISMITQADEEYICLTDMAKGFEGEAGEYIRNWLRNGSTVQYLGVWEKVHNPDFNLVEFHQIKSELVDNTFLMSVKKWIQRTGAIGIQARAGRYGGTYAHNEIAVQFATWLSPEFHVYLVKEFKRLKVKEAQERQESLEWNVKRILSKINYKVHTDAIKERLMPPRFTKGAGIIYAGEADILNMAVFGVTSKIWRAENPDAKGNIRDHATPEQLLVLANLEAVNAELIRLNISQDERIDILNQAAINHMHSLLTSPTISKLPEGK